MSEGPGFLRKVSGVLTSPWEAFDAIGEKDLLRGVAIVLFAAVLAAWAGALYTSKMDLVALVIGQMRQGGFIGPQTPGAQSIDVDAVVGRLLPFIALGSGLGAFNRWIFPNLLVLLAAKILVGQGSSKRAIAMTGFAYTPMVAQHLLRVVDAYRITSPQLAVIVSSRLVATGLIGKALIQALNVFTVFGVATVALTVFAISTNYGTTRKRAAAVTVSAYVAYVLLRTFLPII